MRSIRRLLTAMLVLWTAPASWAAVIHVPADYPTVQLAVDGDEIVVAPGTYRAGEPSRSSLNFDGKSIVVRSSEGARSTFLIPHGNGPVAVFDSGEGTDSVLQGFSLAGGSEGGVVCRASSPTLRGNSIHSNTNSGSGGGVVLDLSSPVLENNEILFNIAAQEGGGVYCFYSSPVMRNNVVMSNYCGSSGGGMAMIGGSYPTIEYSTFYQNTVEPANSSGRGGALHFVSGAGGEIRNSIIWQNYASNGEEILDDAHQGLTVSYSDVRGGYAGVGNLDVDPLFAGPGSDVSLSASSPCIDQGDPNSRPTGTDVGGFPRFLDGLLDGELRVDMGAYEFDHVFLRVTGDFTPGGTLTVDLFGTAGLPVSMVIGTIRGEALVNPFGNLFIDLSAQSLIAPWPALPSTVTGTIPANTPVGLEILLQAVAFGGAGGNLSNLGSAVIE